MCQGEMARSRLTTSGISNFNRESLNNSLAKKYVAITVSMPKIAEGKRTEKTLRPKKLIDGIARYIYKAGL